MKKVIFNGTECTLDFGLYSNLRIAIHLKDESGFPFATATINDPETRIEHGQVLIKNYSENAGMVDALVEAGIVEKEEEFKFAPFWASVWLCNLLDQED